MTKNIYLIYSLSETTFFLTFKFSLSMSSYLGLHDQIADQLTNFENWHLKKYKELPIVKHHQNKNAGPGKKHLCSIRVSGKLSNNYFLGYGEHEHIATQKALEKALAARDKKEKFLAKVNSATKTVVRKMKTSKKFLRKVFKARA